MIRQIFVYNNLYKLNDNARDMGNYNHSQLEELRTDSRRLWEKKIGRKRLNPLGIETPLGHAYSIILEEIARQGFSWNPNPNEFLDFIKKYLIERGKSHKVDCVNLMEPSWSPEHTIPMVLYMRRKGLPSSISAKIMADIVGPNIYEYSEKVLEQYTDFL